MLALYLLFAGSSVTKTIAWNHNRKILGGGGGGGGLHARECKAILLQWLASYYWNWETLPPSPPPQFLGGLTPEATYENACIMGSNFTCRNSFFYKKVVLCCVVWPWSSVVIFKLNM